MAALTSSVTLTGTYTLVATAAVRMVARAPHVAQICIVPTAAPAPAVDAAGFTIAGDDPVNFENLGSVCDVYARGKGILQLFTNTA